MFQKHSWPQMPRAGFKYPYRASSWGEDKGPPPKELKLPVKPEHRWKTSPSPAIKGLQIKTMLFFFFLLVTLAKTKRQGSQC
jgi:hypothetical protein